MLSLSPDLSFWICVYTILYFARLSHALADGIIFLLYIFLASIKISLVEIYKLLSANSQFHSSLSWILFFI